MSPRLGWAAPAAALLALTVGCVAPVPGGDPSGPPPSPSAQGTPSISSAASPTALPPTAGAPSEPSYAGPRPMPAADGGPMLWPTMAETLVVEPGWTYRQTRYGFVDVTGTLVVPPRYDRYEYCRDGSGRPSLVLGSGGEPHTDVLDLTGTVVGEIPGRWVSCVGDTHATFMADISETGPRDVGMGLIELATGKVLVSIEKGRDLAIIDATLVNVHEPEGEYFLDLTTGQGIPHPGWVSDLSGDYRDGTLIPASRELPPDSYSEPEEGAAPIRYGYLDRTGGWALKPTYLSVQGFRDGFAVVSDDEESWHFIDSNFERAGAQDWYDIETEEWGYLAYLRAGEVALGGVLSRSLEPLLPPEQGRADFCRWRDNACLVHHLGEYFRLLVPEGTLTALPDGATWLLSRDLASDEPITRVYNLATSTTFPVADVSSCEAVGTRWVSCPLAWEDVAGSKVYSVDGRLTGFREISQLAEAGGEAYYWAISGRHRGFVDADGNWLYRESRFTDLED